MGISGMKWLVTAVNYSLLTVNGSKWFDTAGHCLITKILQKKLLVRVIWRNKGHNGTNHGLFRQFKTFRTVADGQVSCIQSVS